MKQNNFFLDPTLLVIALQICSPSPASLLRTICRLRQCPHRRRLSVLLALYMLRVDCIDLELAVTVLR